MLSRAVRAMLLALALLPGVASADVVVLRDGRTFEGRILEETSSKVVLETVIANIRVVEEFPRFRVESIERAALPDGFFNPNAATDDDTQHARELQRLAREDRGEDSPDAGADARYVVVPIEGRIGESVTARGVRDALDAVTRRGITHVVFRVDSPGGHIYEAREILGVLGERDDEMTFHTLIAGGAISAATVFAAGADHIYARPDATLGGALAYTDDTSSGNSQVDAKLNSVWGAELAARADAKGHPGDAFRAMAVPSLSVWITPDGDLSPEALPGATRIDDTRSVLTLRASEMRACGMAEIVDDEDDSIGELRDLDGWREIPRVAQGPMRAAARQRQRLIRDADALAREIAMTVEAAEEAEPDAPGRSYRTDYDTGHFVGGALLSWRDNCETALARWSRVRDLLREQANLNDRARRDGALHLLADPGEGDALFRRADERVAWLARNRDRTSPP